LLSFTKRILWLPLTTNHFKRVYKDLPLYTAVYDCFISNYKVSSLLPDLYKSTLFGSLGCPMATKASFYCSPNHSNSFTRFLAVPFPKKERKKVGKCSLCRQAVSPSGRSVSKVWFGLRSFLVTRFIGSRLRTLDRVRALKYVIG
jgi:hypothetical protein